MKKLAIIALGLSLLGVVGAQAQEKKEHKKPALTEEQKKVQKEILEKYDANKNGKLDKDERAKISAEDKQKLKDAGLARGKKDEKKSDSK